MSVSTHHRGRLGDRWYLAAGVATEVHSGTNQVAPAGLVMGAAYRMTTALGFHL
jgi:hypothetical protein